MEAQRVAGGGAPEAQLAARGGSVEAGMSTRRQQRVSSFLALLLPGSPLGGPSWVFLLLPWSQEGGHGEISGRVLQE